MFKFRIVIPLSIIAISLLLTFAVIDAKRYDKEMNKEIFRHKYSILQKYFQKHPNDIKFKMSLSEAIEDGKINNKEYLDITLKFKIKPESREEINNFLKLKISYFKRDKL